MNLRNVPDDEADAVRALLDELDVAWYETPPTAFGLSAGALWIRNDDDHPRVDQAYRQFQAEWTERARRSSYRGPSTIVLSQSTGPDSSASSQSSTRSAPLSSRL